MASLVSVNKRKKFFTGSYANLSKRGFGSSRSVHTKTVVKPKNKKATNSAPTSPKSCKSSKTKNLANLNLSLSLVDPNKLHKAIESLLTSSSNVSTVKEWEQDNTSVNNAQQDSDQHSADLNNSNCKGGVSHDDSVNATTQDDAAESSINKHDTETSDSDIVDIVDATMSNLTLEERKRALRDEIAEKQLKKQEEDQELKELMEKHESLKRKLSTNKTEEEQPETNKKASKGGGVKREIK